MITHLLDTSIYSQHLKRRTLKAVVRRWAKQKAELQRNGVVIGELYHF